MDPRNESGVHFLTLCGIIFPMLILGFQKTTLLDYPGKLASIVFTGGCNLFCPYCQNSELAFNYTPDQIPVISEDEVLDHLEKRRNMLEGLVISGGEPTLQKDLPSFIQKVRSLDLLIKLDTNGTNPSLLGELLDEGLLDYVAMDIKQAMEKYPKACGLPANGDTDTLLNRVRSSISILLSCGIDYEFRTTVVKELFEKKDLSKIASMIKGAKRYFLQGFQKSPGVPESSSFSAPSPEEMAEYEKIMKTLLPGTEVSLRGESAI